MQRPSLSDHSVLPSCWSQVRIPTPKSSPRPGAHALHTGLPAAGGGASCSSCPHFRVSQMHWALPVMWLSVRSWQSEAGKHVGAGSLLGRGSQGSSLAPCCGERGLRSTETWKEGSGTDP